MGRLDELLIFDEPCSVTAFNMHVQLHRDGRERGVWFRLEDTSPSRAETYKNWLENNVDLVAKMLGFDEDKSAKFRTYMLVNSEVGAIGIDHGRGFRGGLLGRRLLLGNALLLGLGHYSAFRCALLLRPRFAFFAGSFAAGAGGKWPCLRSWLPIAL